MNIHTRYGSQVKFVGATDAQVAWGGHDDPRKYLVEGNVYRVQRTEIHSQHTKVELQEYPGKKFNSVCFENVGHELCVGVGDSLRTSGEQGTTVAHITPSSLYSPLITLTADILKARTWGTPLTAQQSERLDTVLQGIAERLKALADAEGGRTGKPTPPTVEGPRRADVPPIVEPPKMTIPPITDPMGKYWEQPSLSEIDVSSGEMAVMSDATFKKLSEYSSSVPSGVYAGKMWCCRALPNLKWFLVWYENVPDKPDRYVTKALPILITNKAGGAS